MQLGLVVVVVAYMMVVILVKVFVDLQKVKIGETVDTSNLDT